MQETWVRSQGQKDPLEKEMAIAASGRGVGGGAGGSRGSDPGLPRASASLPSPRLLVADAGVCAASPLEVERRAESLASPRDEA